jgi:hypothetical protein
MLRKASEVVLMRAMSSEPSWTLGGVVGLQGVFRGETSVLGRRVVSSQGELVAGEMLGGSGSDGAVGTGCAPVRAVRAFFWGILGGFVRWRAVRIRLA